MKDVVVRSDDNMEFIPSPEFLETPIKYRKQWADALRSGTYEQTTGDLITGGAYCCLGVAVCVFDPDNAAYMEGHGTLSSEASVGLFKNAYYILGDDPAVATDRDGTEYSATALNDNIRLTFLQIAALVHPEGEKES